ncbi:hypothetical protein OF846_005321 [Rhodotorula toruloides]|nr:hypothetical protein OF846_005321 [Rhodotorula toruloides]
MPYVRRCSQSAPARVDDPDLLTFSRPSPHSAPLTPRLLAVCLLTMSKMHNTDSETASVACSERSGTSRTDTLLSRTTSEATLVLVRYEGKDTLVNLPDRTYNTFVDQIVRHLQGAQGYRTLFVERSCTGGRWVTVTEGAWERQFEVWEDDLPLFRITMLKYLFWEAEAYKTTSSAPSHLVFDPSNPLLDASNGCALPFAAFLAHLDKTLAALSLHTAARNDFIAYWLSHFTRIRNAGQHIGFLFLVQSDYERAARLDVNPMPDVVTRVFLLFKGVDADQTSEWKKPDEVDWVKKVGVQVDKVTDDSLFRVLEPFPTLVHAFMAPPTTSNKRAASPPSDPSKTKRAREDPAVECCYLAVVKDDERQVLVRISSADYDTAMREIRRVFCRGEGETRASWTVSAQPDGSLVDLASGLELKYLFWEAEAYKTASSTPSHLAFDPSNPSLDASNGCALPFAAFLAHLDQTLAALSLHTAARNDFITYWLSHFTRIRDAGQHIGFRSLAQDDYERATHLDVDPKPDVVTRVFLLFKGVDAGQTSEWKKPDEVDWVKEVGVQVDKAEDKSLFRVLEWGGMEVV